MAGPNQSKKEIIGIELPLPPAERPADPNIKAREAARTQLPVRERMSKMPLPMPVPTPIPAPVAHAPDSSDLKTETVRVSNTPDPPSAQVQKTEAPAAMPDVAAQNPSIALAPTGKNSMLLIWILFGISFLILIIQIWTYLS
jgi:hypothetical protein